MELTISSQETSTILTYPNLIVIDNSTILGLERSDILDEFKEIYEFSNIEEIRNFILQNSYLIDILKEAPQHIYRTFGRAVKIELELHHDFEEAWDELFIVIKSPYSAEKAVELERKFFEEWFVHKMDDTKGKLDFTEEPL